MRTFIVSLLLLASCREDDRWEWTKLGPTNPTWDEWPHFLGRAHPTPVGVWIAYDKEGKLPPRYNVLLVEASGDVNDKTTWTWTHSTVPCESAQ